MKQYKCCYSVRRYDTDRINYKSFDHFIWVNRCKYNINTTLLFGNSPLRVSLSTVPNVYFYGPGLKGEGYIIPNNVKRIVDWIHPPVSS